jgi:hypothetical protein
MSLAAPAFSRLSPLSASEDAATIVELALRLETVAALDLKATVHTSTAMRA